MGNTNDNMNINRMLLVSVCGIYASRSETTIDPAAKHAYAANAGWINFAADGANGVVVGDRFLSGWAYGANFGWIHFGDGSPVDGLGYANTSGTDYGVNHDGAGILSGYAYAPNIGWINFEQVHGKPKIRLASGPTQGAFTGYAYSGNIGWVNLTPLATASMIYLDAEDDGVGDGIGDSWELLHFGNLTTATATSDSDGDGQSDRLEYQANTDPNDASSRVSHAIIAVHPISATTRSIDHVFSVFPNRLAVVQYSPNLLNWTDGESYSAETTTMISATQGFPASGKQFFRIEYRLPLQP